MEDTVKHPTVRGGISIWVRRYQTTLELIVAAFFGLVVFPVIFLALRGQDIRLGGQISLVDLVWLVLALAACLFVLRARAASRQWATNAVDRLLTAIPEVANSNSGSPAPGPVTAVKSDATEEGRALARGLLDLLILLVIQAILRPPLVGVVSDVAPAALVDGSYVVVVVLLAFAILFSLNRVGRPLAERLTWLGLNQFVPTAGFATNSATAAFTIRLATTSSRLGSSTHGSRSGPAQVSASGADSLSAPTLVAADTVAANPAPVGEATVLAPERAAAPLEATVAEVPASNTLARVPVSGDATVVGPVESTETVVQPGVADETRMDGGKGESP